MRISDWSSDVCSSDLDTSEVRLIPADAPETPPILISARQVKRQYSVDMAHGTLWVLTNDDHVNFRLARATLVDPEKWETVIPGSDSVYLRGISSFADHLILTERVNGLSSEEHTSELQSLMRTSYDVLCLKKKKN